MKCFGPFIVVVIVEDGIGRCWIGNCRPKVRPFNILRGPADDPAFIRPVPSGLGGGHQEFVHEVVAVLREVVDAGKFGGILFGLIGLDV